MDFSMEMLAYCGLYCEQCSVRTAYAEQDCKHLERFPARYKKDRMDLADCDCEGCKGRNLCGPCKIKDCAKLRDIDTCAECPDFPCAVLGEFGNDGIPHHAKALENLRSIRERGIESWFATLTPALRCHCGERQSWYYLCPAHTRA